MDPALRDLWPDEKRHREMGSVESEVETGAMPLKAKGDKGWSAATGAWREAWDQSPPDPPEGTSTADTLVLDMRPPGLGADKFLVLST